MDVRLVVLSAEQTLLNLKLLHKETEDTYQPVNGSSYDETLGSVYLWFLVLQFSLAIVSTLSVVILRTFTGVVAC